MTTVQQAQLVQPGAALAPAEELAGRIAGLQARLADRGLDAALLQQNADLFYFAGTVQQSFLYVPAEGEPTLFVRKVAERARLESALGAIVDLPSPKELPRLIAERYGALAPRLGLELDVLPVAYFRRLEKLLAGASFEDVGRDIVRQRAVKSPWEVERIRAAARVADEVSRLIPGILEEGLTEVEFAGKVEAEARRLGHEGYIRMRGFNQEMFYGQLLTGISGCVPSYLDTPLAGTGLSPSVAQGASFRRIGRGEPVVFDFVPVRDGYMADFTRMYSIGPLSAGLLHAYDAALRVEEAATAAARPGASCRDVWEAARTAAEGAGLAANFMGHGAGRVPYVGHGIGIELDELPVLTGSDLELEAGMVFALEPKFVLPGVGAIGVENTWVVTGDGVERLTLAPETIGVIA
ncbi:MAG TPA: Xaa-Pro peptidase family protein [Thermoleophilia bacterium]|nr:Xaa-Pro peptidase family protein [Thermoleophilia bacterium]